MNIEQNAVNLSIKHINHHLNILLNNALNFNNSLRIQEIDFKLITNNKKAAHRILGNHPLKIEEIKFGLDVPEGTRFSSAHRKLDIYKYLSMQENGYYIFCDLDMMCINDLPDSLIYNIVKGIPLVYDISDQVIPAYSAQIITSDMSRLPEEVTEGRWYGGEFIAGTPSFFFSLYKEIEKLVYKYFQLLDTFHHIGDEMIVSTALAKLRIKGHVFGDAGTLGIVSRYWSVSPKHTQKSFDSNKNVFLIHLPADKYFLSKLSKYSLNTGKEYYMKYRNYIYSISFLTRIKYQEFKKRLLKFSSN